MTPKGSNHSGAATKRSEQPESRAANIADAAFEIAHALLEEGYGEGSVIRAGFARAKQRATGRSDHGSNHSPRANFRRDLHIVPYPGGWVLRRADTRQVSLLFKKQEDAYNLAMDMAENEGVDVILHTQTDPATVMSVASMA